LRVQQVLPPDGGPESWTVADEQFAVVEPAEAFLAHLTAIERSPGTVRAYAFDLRDYFEFLSAHEIDWRTVCLEHLGRFVGWLRLPPTMRTASVTSLSTIEARCSAPTTNQKLAAVGSFYKFHHRHGVDCGELQSTMKAGWRPASRARAWSATRSTPSPTAGPAPTASPASRRLASRRSDEQAGGRGGARRERERRVAGRDASEHVRSGE